MSVQAKSTVLACWVLALAQATQDTQYGTRPLAGDHKQDRRAGGEDVVRLGLLLPMTGWSAGKYIAGAATLAINKINEDQSLMRGRRLDYIWANSGNEYFIPANPHYSHECL